MIEGLGSQPRLHLARRDFRYGSEADTNLTIFNVRFGLISRDGPGLLAIARGLREPAEA